MEKRNQNQKLRVINNKLCLVKVFIMLLSKTKFKHSGTCDAPDESSGEDIIGY